MSLRISVSRLVGACASLATALVLSAFDAAAGGDRYLQQRVRAH